MTIGCEKKTARLGRMRCCETASPAKGISCPEGHRAGTQAQARCGVQGTAVRCEGGVVKHGWCVRVREDSA